MCRGKKREIDHEERVYAIGFSGGMHSLCSCIFL